MTAIALTATTVRTRALLTAGALATPVFFGVSLAQVFTREGFDLTRHPLSLLSTGSLGWLQIANFLTIGVLLIAGSIGFKRAGYGTWAPRLIRIAGIGMMAAGVLVMDPSDGFPLGTPYGMPVTMSWHGIAHMAAGSISFFSLIAVGFVLGRHFSRAGHRGLAIASRVAAAILIVGDGWAMTGGKAGSLTLAIGVFAAMGWVSLVAAARR